MIESLNGHPETKTNPNKLFDIGEEIVVTIHVLGQDGEWEPVDTVNGTSHHISSPHPDHPDQQILTQGIILNEESFKYVSRGSNHASRAPSILTNEPFTHEGYVFRTTVELATSR